MSAAAPQARVSRAPRTPRLPARLPDLALAVLVVGTGALLWHLTRGFIFYQDDWSFLMTRDVGLSALTEPWNAHLVLGPSLMYRALTAVAGYGSPGAFRAAAIGAHLAVVVAVYVYARGRVGAWAALGLAAVVALFGPGYVEFFWPLLAGTSAALALGIAALLLLERARRGTDVLACLALVAALGCSSSHGVLFAGGAAVEILVARQVRARWWVPGVPLLLYAAWSLARSPSLITADNALLAPRYAADQFASIMQALSGLGLGADWGRPLAVVAVLATVAIVARRWPPAPRLAAVLAMLAALLAFTALARASLAEPGALRYMYPGAVLAILCGVELARGWRPPPVVAGAAAAAVLFAIAGNLLVLRDGMRLHRNVLWPSIRAQVTAMDIAARTVAPGTTAIDGPTTFTAAQYLPRAARHGAAGDDAAALEARSEGERDLVDRALVAMLPVTLGPAPGRRPAAGVPPPRLAAPAPGVRGGGPCLRAVPGAAASVAVVVPRTGISIRPGAAAAVTVRRFGRDGTVALGTVPGGATWVLRPPADREPRPWTASIAAPAGAVVCRLAPAR